MTRLLCFSLARKFRGRRHDKELLSSQVSGEKELRKNASQADNHSAVELKGPEALPMEFRARERAFGKTRNVEERSILEYISPPRRNSLVWGFNGGDSGGGRIPYSIIENRSRDKLLLSEIQSISHLCFINFEKPGLKLQQIPGDEWKNKIWLSFNVYGDTRTTRLTP